MCRPNLTRLTVVTALTVLALATVPGRARAQFEHMIGRVPKEANALVLVNGDKIFSSPIAVKNNWQVNRKHMYESGVAFLPPAAKSGLLAAHIDFGFMVPLWELSLYELGRDVSVDEVVKHTRGTLDNVAGKQIIATHTDSFIVPVSSRIFGTIIPANRQLVARWLRDYQNAQTPNLSNYLTEAYGFAKNDGTPVILALDLEDIVTLDGAKSALRKADDLALSPEEVDSIAKVLASLKGIMFGITLRDAVFGKIKVDFYEDAAPLGKHGKQILLHVLSKQGAMIDELATWDAKVSGKQLTLEGFLTPSGARRLASLFHRPMTVSDDQLAESSAPNAPRVPEESLVREASKKYFTNVTSLLHDLKVDSREFSTYGQTALWMDKYANKIDEQPVLNVDDELIKYGSFASESLRYGASTLRSSLNQASTAAKDVPTQYNTYTYGQTYGYSYRYGLLGGGMMPWGSYGYVNVPDIYATNAIKAKVRGTTERQGAISTREVMQNLQKATGEVRQKMTKKYMEEFKTGT